MRLALACIIGVAIAVIVVLVTETIGHLIFPPPEGVDLKDPEQLAAIMDTIPFGAKLSVLIAWTLGVFVGCFAALKIAGGPQWPAHVVAGLMLAFIAMTLSTIPHPVWMVVGAVLLTILAWLAARKLA